MMIFNGQNVKLYPMNYDNYLEAKGKEVQSLPLKKENKPSKIAPPKAERKPNNTFKISKIESEIEEHEERLKVVNEEMAHNSDNSDALYDLFKEKEQLEIHLDELLEIWSELQ